MRKILIIKMGALGDVVIATSIIMQIKKHHVSDRVWLLTSPPYKDIFKPWENLNVVTFERKGFVEFFKIIRWIRKQNFNRVYDLQSNDRSSIICAFTGIAETIGNHPHFPYNIHPTDKYTGQCHIYERMLKVLVSAGIDPQKSPPVLLSNEEEKILVHDWLVKHRLEKGSFVILHAGASTNHPEKCWPYFLELAQAINKSGYIVVWIGAKTDTNANQNRAITVGIDASGVFGINSLAELGRNARFAITNDSGPMHVLSASGIPVYAFFGPTDWRRHHAYGQENNVITAAIKNKYEPLNSLSKISVNVVLARLEKDGVITTVHSNN